VGIGGAPCGLTVFATGNLVVGDLDARRAAYRRCRLRRPSRGENRSPVSLFCGTSSAPGRWGLAR
jgi:hypothetical protein